jgi:hypothetical protein
LTCTQIFGIAYTACICLSVQSGLGVAEDLLDEERVERLSKVRTALIFFPSSH